MRGVVVVLILTACSSSNPGSKCIEGATQACTCTDGQSGAQTCDATGAFGACTCTGGQLDAPMAQLGVSWEKALTPSFGPRANFSYALHGGSEYLVGGLNTGTSGFDDVWSSSDGVTWNAVTGNAGLGVEVYQGCMVSFAGALWLINQNTVYSSPDGVTWTQQAPTPTGYFSNGPGGAGAGCVVWNNTWWIISAYANGQPQAVLSSPDGVNWTTAASSFGATASTISLVVYNNELFAITSAGIFASADGTTWLPKTLSFKASGPAVVADGAMWTFDANFALSKSTDGVTWTTVQASLPWSDTIAPPNTIIGHRTLFTFYSLGTPAKLFIAGGQEAYHVGAGISTQYDGDIWVSP